MAELRQRNGIVPGLLTASVLTLLLTGCEGSPIDSKRRILKYQADILEMYRNCLKRKQKEPKVECSEYRTAIEIKLAK